MRDSLLRSLMLPILVTGLTSVTTSAAAAPTSRLWSFWEEHDPTSRIQPDHLPWQAFLDSFLKPGDDGINRIDYNGVQQDHRAQLNDYIRSLTSSNPRILSRDAQLAYWINLYNALTVEVVLRHPNKGSILRMGQGLFSIGPWNDALIEIEDQRVTLNDIEHRILRPIWQDRRVHYAVNCASLGCPNLASKAYNADNVEALLSATEVEYINHPRGVSFTNNGKLELSSIFKWYRVDFGTNRREVLDYLARHHNSLAARIADHDRSIGYRYDWSLNRHLTR